MFDACKRSCTPVCSESNNPAQTKIILVPTRHVVQQNRTDAKMSKLNIVTHNFSSNYKHKLKWN